ncbi:hypothetical protein RBE51_21470 [Pseudomonas taiwanensis]|uniref:hypothetical protein n=1 Tax=Pseudomonas taiwanensis TaxID=470150 RepID=UPI0028DFED66|nr:hypothetical protein [Pseudomonas taiwanensis]MDT8925369.1 hypothetical protein [Pseudomonas taiwanensis]
MASNERPTGVELEIQKYALIATLESPATENGRLAELMAELPFDFSALALREAIIEVGVDYLHSDAIEKLSPGSAEIVKTVIKKYEASIFRDPGFLACIDYASLQDDAVFNLLNYCGLKTPIANELLRRTATSPDLADRMFAYVDLHEIINRPPEALLSIAGAEDPALAVQLIQKLAQGATDRPRLQGYIHQVGSEINPKDHETKRRVLSALLTNITDPLTVYEGIKCMNPILMVFKHLPVNFAVRSNVLADMMVYVERNREVAAQWFTDYPVAHVTFPSIMKPWASDGDKRAADKGMLSGGAAEALDSLSIKDAVKTIVLLDMMARIPEGFSPQVDVEKLTDSEMLLFSPLINDSVVKKLLERGRAEGYFNLAELMDAEGDQLYKYSIISHLVTPQYFIENCKQNVAEAILEMDLGL